MLPRDLGENLFSILYNLFARCQNYQIVSREALQLQRMTAKMSTMSLRLIYMIKDWRENDQDNVSG